MDNESAERGNPAPRSGSEIGSRAELERAQLRSFGLHDVTGFERAFESAGFPQILLFEIAGAFLFGGSALLGWRIAEGSVDTVAHLSKDVGGIVLVAWALALPFVWLIGAMLGSMAARSRWASIGLLPMKALAVVLLPAGLLAFGFLYGIGCVIGRHGSEQSFLIAEVISILMGIAFGIAFLWRSRFLLRVDARALWPGFLIVMAYSLAGGYVGSRSAGEIGMMLGPLVGVTLGAVSCSPVRRGGSPT